MSSHFLSFFFQLLFPPIILHQHLREGVPPCYEWVEWKLQLANRPLWMSPCLECTRVPSLPLPMWSPCIVCSLPLGTAESSGSLPGFLWPHPRWKQRGASYQHIGQEVLPPYMVSTDIMWNGGSLLHIKDEHPNSLSDFSDTTPEWGWTPIIACDVADLGSPVGLWCPGWIWACRGWL